MAKKTYKTYSIKSLQVLLFDGQGRPIEVNFKGGLHIDSTAKFSTNDEKVQNALEKCSGFNRDFYLESVREDKPADAAGSLAPAKEADDVADGSDWQTVDVADKADAIEWLKEHYPEKGYTGAKLRSREAFVAACTECNVRFVFPE